jgi:type I restriction enzyme S subunit
MQARLTIFLSGVSHEFPGRDSKGKVAEEFTALCADNIAQQQAFIFQIQNLRRTRDLLLPRLLSGQINLGGCNG